MRLRTSRIGPLGRISCMEFICHGRDIINYIIASSIFESHCFQRTGNLRLTFKFYDFKQFLFDQNVEISYKIFLPHLFTYDVCHLGANNWEKNQLYLVSLSICNTLYGISATTILCSVLNWRVSSHYIFIRQENNLFDRAHLLLQAYITLILHACIMCTQPRDAHLGWQARDYFCAWIYLSLIISANLVLNKV